MGDAFSKLGINYIFLLGQIVNFLILFIALRFLLWKPLLQKLDERREMLEKEKDDAAAIEEARANIGDERARSLEEVHEKAKAIIAEAREQASVVTDQVAQEASQEAEKIVETARTDAEEERNRTLGEMRSQIAALAISAAQQVIGEKLDEERQRALVDSFFSGIRDGRVEIMEDVEPAEAPVTVTSAITLTEEEQDTIRRDLTERIGEGFELSFKVDPNLLGGLVVRVGDRVMDGSVIGQLGKLQESLA